MITRRAMIDLTHMFQKPIGLAVGDFAAMVGDPSRHQIGRVVAIDAIIRKVWVSWTADELILQHDVADLVKVEGKCAAEGRRTRDSEAKPSKELKCNRCGKTIPPVKGYENSAWRHCPCGGVATKKASEETHDDKCLCHDCLAKKNSPLLMASSRRFQATLSKVDELE